MPAIENGGAEGLPNGSSSEKTPLPIIQDDLQTQLTRGPDGVYRLVAQSKSSRMAGASVTGELTNTTGSAAKAVAGV